MTPALPHALDTYLHTHYTNQNPGAALLVAKGEEVCYEGCIGLADVSTGQKITGTTNFRMASVSKQFTAMAVQLLVQQGRLAYTSPLHRILPELAALSQHITIRQLLTHTSGLPDYEAFIPEDREEQASEQEVLEILSLQRTLLFAPGAQYRYSNTGYVLLALVVERVAGLPYADFLKQHIFGPLGMQHTQIYKKGCQINNRTMGYKLNRGGGAVLSDQSACSATQGDGCIYTSLHDYLKWHLALEQSEQFSLKATLTRANTTLCGNPNWHYGMGWFFAKRNSGNYELYHTGNTCGFSNLVIRIPERQVLVACFTNLADNPYLVGALVDVLQQYPETKLESRLVRKLLELTR